MGKVLTARYEETDNEVIGIVNEVNSDTIKNLLSISDFDFSDKDISDLVSNGNAYTDDDVELQLTEVRSA